jgi:hypothetical protein
MCAALLSSLRRNDALAPSYAFCPESNAHAKAGTQFTFPSTPCHVCRLSLPRCGRQHGEENLSMMKQKLDFPVADRNERRNDFAHTLAAMIEITRRDWMPARQTVERGNVVADAERRELCMP